MSENQNRNEINSENVKKSKEKSSQLRQFSNTPNRKEINGEMCKIQTEKKSVKFVRKGCPKV